ncbi:MAG: hypothetical protein PHS61_04420 [Candidatus Omnitrophica bacterium]|nr:hypothetical protein [Candidatus Omnitrophota bacterium]
MNARSLNEKSGFRNERRLSEGRTLPECERPRSACPVIDTDGSVRGRALKDPVSNGARPLFSLRLSRRGQQIGEYALVLAAISSALLMMYVYTKRGIQSTIKDLTDHEIGWQNDSVPILASGAHQNMTSTMGTRQRDTVRIRKDPDLGIQYDYTVVSTSTGESNMTFNEM